MKMNGRRLKFNRSNTLKSVVPNKPGLYKLYNSNGEIMYVGVAKKLRHRLQSYRQKDCFATHPTKSHVRGKIASFYFEKIPIKSARKKEKRIKKNTLFNFR